MATATAGGGGFLLVSLIGSALGKLAKPGNLKKIYYESLIVKILH